MASHLPSEKVIVSSPMSFDGSARRIWKITKQENQLLSTALMCLSVIVISFVWLAIILWYILFGIFLIPYRLIRRGQRKEKRDRLRHQEILEATKERKEL